MRVIRREDRAITRQEMDSILCRGEFGTLSTVDSNGIPYGVPLSYIYRNNALYFHSAETGHKLDNIKDNSLVSFCVVGSTAVLPHKFSTLYESVIVSGRAVQIDGEEKLDALLGLVEKYSSDHLEAGKSYIASAAAKTAVVKIIIGSMTGKARR